MLRIAFIICIVLLFAMPVAAQTEIGYGQLVNGAITDEEFFNRWTFFANATDEIDVTMDASDGLLPLVGLLDPAGDLVARSNDGAPDGIVRLRYTIEREGVYSLVATRVGNEEGTTTGTYSLVLDLVGQQGMPLDAREVSFRCGEFEAVTALKLQLYPEMMTPSVPLRINIYGLDGFQTLVRLRGEELDFNLCERGNVDNPGDILYLPDQEPLLIDETLMLNQYDLRLSDPAINGTLTLTLGSVGGAPGRYVIVLQGFAIDTADGEDTVVAEVGARAASSSSYAYVIADDNQNSRLDPYIAGDDTIGCDDAGRRGCEGVPSFNRAGIRIVDDLTLLGDRFDAGLLLRTDDLEPQSLEIRSFSGNTFGAYALFFIGLLPPI